MPKLASLATATALASILLMGPALAQTATPAVKDATKTESKAPADAAKAAADKKQRSAVSLECSKEADAKGLRGKERKKFRSECKRQKSEATADQPK